MVEAGEEVLRCVLPGCENELQPGVPGAAERGYCGPPDQAAGEPHLALTEFGWR
jgi:hypothetical protein